MRLKISILVSLFILSIFLNFNILAQFNPIPIVRSTEKVLIGGKIFFVHTVKKGETLYSIAKAYFTTVEEVINNNPSLSSDLQLGQTIKIPDSQVKLVESQSLAPKEGQLLHVVSAGQTIYSISRIYNIPVANIEILNPELKYDSLQIDQVIKIPLENNIIQKDSTNNLIHKVVEKETLYFLSRKYGVSQEEILKLNDSLLINGLKVGQEVKIPIIKTAINSKNLVIEQLESDCTFETLKVKHDSINISLLLPLFTLGNTTENSISDDENDNDENLHQKQTDEFNPVAINFIEFYQGFMLASSELKKKGLHLKISVFDTENSTKNINSILEKPAFKKSDIVFGPVYPDQIKIAIDKLSNTNSILVSPVAQHNELTKKYPQLFQVNPGIEFEYKKCVEQLLSDTLKNIIIVYKSEANVTTDSYVLFNQILDYFLQARPVKIRKMNVFNNDFSMLQNELDSLNENIVFSPICDEIFITTMFGQLDAKLLYYKIKAVGMQEWVNYRGIDLNYFYDLQMVYFTPFYINYKSEITNSLLRKYRMIYGTDPIRNSKYGFNYGIMGYNLAYYFVSAYSYFGFEISNHADCLKKLPTTSHFQFIPEFENGGFVNNSLKMVTFSKDYSLIIGE